MNNLSRRGFFRLAAGAAALTSVPAAAFSAPAPIVWCDGVHDDGPALAALFRGDVVEFRDVSMAERIGWRGDTLFLDGTFTIKSTVKVPGTFDRKTVIGGHYDVQSTFLDVSEAKGARFMGMSMDMTRAEMGSWAIVSNGASLGVPK